MRKLLSALGCLMLMAGLVVAGEVTLVKFDKETKELKVKEGDAEKTYKITAKTKFIAVDKASGETKALTYDEVVKGLSNAKAEGKLKFDITVKAGDVVEAKLPGRRKK